MAQASEIVMKFANVRIQMAFFLFLRRYYFSWKEKPRSLQCLKLGALIAKPQNLVASSDPEW